MKYKITIEFAEGATPKAVALAEHIIRTALENEVTNIRVSETTETKIPPTEPF